MWTPRRILILLATLTLLVGAYIGYAQMLGSVDGLPDLPAIYREPLDSSTEPFVPAPEEGGPTVARLKQAFGPTSPEATDLVAYKIRTERRDSGLVLACGQPGFSPAAEPSPIVGVAPFSVAFFGKPDPQAPQATPEITTAHGDRARLEFDRPVATPQEMSQAKLIAFTLESTPDEASRDPRRGTVEVTNNQKSDDLADLLVVTTRGPVYYRDPDAGLPPDAPAQTEVAQLSTAAEVVVVNRKNLPRSQRGSGGATARLSGDDLRRPSVVPDILTGRSLPPPTITAVGLKVYLVKAPTNPPPGVKRNPAGYSSVRRIELVKQVQFNLWTDSGTGFPGTTPNLPKPQPDVDAPPALGALTGGLPEGHAAGRLAASSLVVIETLGGFRYDFPTGHAEFETATAIDHQANHVSVTRIGRGTTDNMFCERLAIELEGASGLAEPANTAPTPSGQRIKTLTATGTYVFVSVEAEQLLAQGTRLVYTTDTANRTTTTTLTGTPVTAKRERNQLSGGSPGVPADIVILSTDPAPGADPASPAARRQTSIRVLGPGEAALYDAETRTSPIHATWANSLIQERVVEGGMPLDLLKFDGRAKFEDTKTDITLAGDRLWLWLAGRTDRQPGQPVVAATQTARPHRLDAIGSVAARSPELVIQNTSQLQLRFRESPLPPTQQPEPVPGSDAPAAVASAPPAEAAPAPDAAPTDEPPPRRKPPVVLAARTIEATLGRHPVPQPDPNSTAAAKFRYEMEHAVCVGRVVAHQDPADPTKTPRGLDIQGERLTLAGERVNGEMLQAMTVTGATTTPAQVHFEAVSLIGPEVLIDQPRNTVAVDGVGTLLMPVQRDQGGNATAKPYELEIKWARRMRFNGATATAEFLGQVTAAQQPARADRLPRPALGKPPADTPPDDGTWTQSRMMCHRLDAFFDRPVYFNQLKRDNDPKKPAEPGPKLKRATGIPIPDDEAAQLATRPMRTVIYTDETYDRANKLLKAQRIEAQELDVSIADRRQDLVAVGPGEVRILQPDSSTQSPVTPGRPTENRPAAANPGPYKLTLAQFLDRMTGVDKARVFQQAVFTNGARVWQVPTNNINLVFQAHLAPGGTSHLSSDESLEVSSSRSAPGATADQRMTATGNALFYDDANEGTASRIDYTDNAVVFTGAGDRPAAFYRRGRTIQNSPQARAARLTYNPQTKTLAADGVTGGVFTQP